MRANANKTIILTVIIFVTLLVVAVMQIRKEVNPLYPEKECKLNHQHTILCEDY